MDSKKPGDQELVELIFTEGDTLTGEFAGEVISRGERMVRLLDDIISDRYAWSAEIPDWWAVTHATYLLAAIGGQRVVPPLIRALRYAEAFYNDWVLDLMPSMLGSLGPYAEENLKAIAQDRGEQFLTRTVAMEGLAAATMGRPEASGETFRIIETVFSDPSEHRITRQGAGIVLLDFKRQSMKDALLAFSREEQAILDYDPEYPAAFLPDDVRNAFSDPNPETAFYKTKWMAFYNADEIVKRQHRWALEDKKDAAHPEQIPAEQMSHAGKGLLRDSPCPCGSGKKFRNCCMGKLH
ncbi:MAG: SEC-C domain-containing protein [Myxococcota bacterium]|jgi:hypothetical protein